MSKEIFEKSAVEILKEKIYCLYEMHRGFVWGMRQTLEYVIEEETKIKDGLNE